MGKKRTLRESRSGDLDDLEAQLAANKISRTAFFTMKKTLLDKDYAVPQEKLTKAFAQNRYGQSFHVPLMAVTIIIRLVLGAVPSVREHGLKEMSWNSNRLEKCWLFAHLDPGGKRAISQEWVRTATRAMSSMHVHAPWAKNDLFHVRIAPIVKNANSLAAKIHMISMLLTFSFVTQFSVVKRNVLESLVHLKPTAFAKKCWDLRIVPVTCRYGQGRRKSWHKQLLDFARVGNARGFQQLIAKLHTTLVLSLPLCATIAAMLTIPVTEGVNRVAAMISFMNHVSAARGDLLQKNLFEAFVAQKLFDPTGEEKASLPNGPGSSKFWQAAGVTRADATQDLVNISRKLQSISVVDGEGTKHTLASETLGFTPQRVDEILLQYWACAEGRILKVVEGFLRQARHPVPYSLLPNADIVAAVADAFASK